jgi:hypothetical protein
MTRHSSDTDPLVDPRGPGHLTGTTSATEHAASCSWRSPLFSKVRS